MDGIHKTTKEQMLYYVGIAGDAGKGLEGLMMENLSLRTNLGGQHIPG